MTTDTELKAIAAAAAFGIETLDIVRTVLWREGMILAVVLMWAVSMRKFARRTRG